ncbi:MAG: glycosyltransferase family 39 protein [Lachnospiraceae bacterium]|nr:glycosyltransferase family 39 protein [Lachnospiraceae bacterium]
MNKPGRDKEIIFVGAAFAFYFFIVMYKLTYSSLWIDETIEYWYSKYLFGTLPYETSSLSMYSRIISTFQPPLFNVILYFWLKISSAEWWLRFFGVVMGFVGMAGIYQSIKKFSNSFVAATGVIFSATIYQLVYYWQECAEYCLMLGTLCWTVYFWICLLQEVSKKNIIRFTIAAIVPIYSQYGAAFPVLAMAAIAFLYTVLKKDKKNLITISISYVTALVAAGLPLYFLFLKQQMMNQSKGYVAMDAILYEGGFLRDFVNGFKTVLKWNFLSYYDSTAVTFVLIVICLLILVSLIFGKSMITKWMVLYNAVTWVLYYFAVKFGIYGEGLFGQRYSVFFIPLWVIMIFAVCVDVYLLIKENPELVIPKFKTLNLSDLKYFVVGISICTVVCYGMYSWTESLRHNWSKDDIRGVVDAWYEEKAFEKETIIYYGANPGFAYYVEQHQDYQEQNGLIKTNVHYMEWMFNQSVEAYTDFINSAFGSDWPEELYIVVSFGGDDLFTLMESFISRGYSSEELYNEGGGVLLHLTNQ